MKKGLLFIGILLLLFTTSSCKGLKNNYIVKENGVDITVLDSHKAYLLSKQYPSIHFDYNGVRVSTYTTSSKVIFVQNDQYALSEAFKKHIEAYDLLIDTRSEERTEDKNGAKLGKDKLPLDENTSSLEKISIATLDDGTRISYLYRTFVSNNIRYYAYTYTENMSISMELPFMVVKYQNEYKLVLLALPYDTKYSVGTNIELSTLLDKKTDKYLNTTKENFYIFNYCEYLKNNFETEEQMQNEIIKWYKHYCNLQQIDGNYYFEYLGIRFSLTFGYQKNNEPAFKIDFVDLVK